MKVLSVNVYDGNFGPRGVPLDVVLRLAEPYSTVCIQDCWDQEPFLATAAAQCLRPLRLRADRRYFEIVLGDRLGHVGHVRDPKLIGELLIALMHPVRLINVIRHDDQLKPRMRRHSTRQVTVLHHAEHAGPKCLRLRHLSCPPFR